MEQKSLFRDVYHWLAICWAAFFGGQNSLSLLAATQLLRLLSPPVELLKQLKYPQVSTQSDFLL
jgi:hypothetical protein